MTERPPYESKFPYSTAPNVVPERFKETWAERVDEWGEFLKQAYVQFAELVADFQR